MNVNFDGKSIEVSASSVGSFGKVMGLMFRSSSGNLLFEFERDVRQAIHSWFVFFPFLAVWLDSNNDVIESRIVRPFSSYVIPKKSFRKLLEIPLNTQNKKFVDFFVDKGKV